MKKKDVPTNKNSVEKIDSAQSSFPVTRPERKTSNQKKATKVRVANDAVFRSWPFLGK